MDNLKYSEILQRNKTMFLNIKGKPYKIKILSNITINSIKEFLEYILLLNQINPKIEIGNYDNIIQDSANCSEDDLVIIFYNLQNIIENISSFFDDIDDETYENIKNKICNELDIIFDNLKNSPSVIFNLFSSIEFTTSISQKSKVELLAVDLNRYLNENKPLNVNLINIEKLIAQIGVNQSIDFRLFHSSKAPYSLSFLKKYVSSIESILLKNNGKLKKALIFDCDNTLWKGILGEDSDIDMSKTSLYGKIYYKIQQIAVFLSKRGTLIGLCSKNNENDVLDVLINHPDMVLKNDFITIKKVNWEDKATNLKSIANELNIGLDSIVFVDDSQFEINLINNQLPEVYTLQVPKEIYEYPKNLLNIIYKYFNLNLNQDDLNKADMYKQQFVRESFKSKFETLEDYLSSLNISLTIHKDEQTFVPRIAQLTQKTNQFNLTTKRYVENQILNLIKSANDFIFTITVEDKFGDSGLTGLCIIKKNLKVPGNVIIDTFLMSCRIIGRNIEYAFMDFVFDWLICHHYETVNAEFQLTKKNEQVKNFYDNLGFRIISDSSESKKYIINLKDYVKKNIPYINIKMDKIELN